MCSLEYRRYIGQEIVKEHAVHLHLTVTLRTPDRAWVLNILLSMSSLMELCIFVKKFIVLNDYLLQNIIIGKMILPIYHIHQTYNVTHVQKMKGIAN